MLYFSWLDQFCQVNAYCIKHVPKRNSSFSYTNQIQLFTDTMLTALVNASDSACD